MADNHSEVLQNTKTVLNNKKTEKTGNTAYGKIIRSISGFYDVVTESGIYRCRARGLFRAQGRKPLVGDDCEIEITDTVSDPQEGSVTLLLPRRNELVRPNVANVDQALLVFAITNPQPSYNMLDRFLISMHIRELPAILCFNKQDLALPRQIEELRSVYEKCGCRVLFISTYDEHALESVRDVLKGKTTVITGPSGAGKSSLINRLCPDAKRETGELSRKIARGKNTTRVVELLSAGENTYLMDTPGFTSLYLTDVEAGDLKEYYPEFAEYAQKCRFSGCMHMAEPGCAVKRAVEVGAISRIRYTNYTEIYEELKNQPPVYKRKRQAF